jgi:hypothetical protein
VPQAITPIPIRGIIEHMLENRRLVVAGMHVAVLRAAIEDAGSVPA